MGINSIIYLSEVIVLAIAIISVLIMAKKKHRKATPKFIGITIGICVLILVGTFLLEKPEMQINEIQVIEAKSQTDVLKPNTFYHFQDVTKDVKLNGNIDYNKVGEYDVTYEVNTMFGTFTMPAKAVTITPIVTKVPYTLTIISHGGNNGSTDRTYTVEDTVTLTNPTRDHSDFA